MCNGPIRYHVIFASCENLVKDNVVKDYETFGTKLARHLKGPRVKAGDELIDATFAKVLKCCPKFRRPRAP